MKTHPWKTEPISCTCEVREDGESCNNPTVAAYRAMTHGWMSLCQHHALKHPEAVSTDVLIASGETWR